MAIKRDEINTEHNQGFDFKAGKVRMDQYAKRSKGAFAIALRSKSNKKGDFSGRLAGKSLKTV